MKYSELERRIAQKDLTLWKEHSVNLNAGTGTLRCTWYGALEDCEYPLKLSPEYVALCKKLNALRIISAKFEDKGDYVLALPGYQVNSNGFQFVKAEVRKNRYCTTYKSFALYNGEILDVTPSSYESEDWGNADTAIGMWRDNLVFRSYNEIFMMSKDGIVKFVGYYPEDSESGLVKLVMKDDKVTVSEYVYYDNDHHHGGWKTHDYDLKQIA